MLTKKRAIRVHPWFVPMWLAAHQVTRGELARLAGVHHSTVSKVLRNRRDVSAEKKMQVLTAIAARTGCEVEELLAGRLAA